MLGFLCGACDTILRSTTSSEPKEQAAEIFCATIDDGAVLRSSTPYLIVLDGNSIRNDDRLVLCAVWAGSWLGLDVLDDSSSNGRRRRGLARFYRPDYFGAFPPWTYAFAPGTRIEDVQLAGHLGPPPPTSTCRPRSNLFPHAALSVCGRDSPSSPFHQRPDSERNRSPRLRPRGRTCLPPSWLGRQSAAAFENRWRRRRSVT